MNNEEKILQVLTEMQTDIKDLKEDVGSLKDGQNQMQSDITNIKGDIKRLDKKIDKVEHNLKSEIARNSKIILDEIERRVNFDEWQKAQTF